jgi:H+/gluconate symporter-like permease
MSVGSKIALGLIFGLIGFVLFMVIIVKAVDHYINKNRKSTIEANNNVWNEQVNPEKGQFSAVPHIVTPNPCSSNMV